MRALRCSLVAAAAAVLGCAASPPPPSPQPYAAGAPPVPMGLQATPYPAAPVAVRWQQFCEQAMSVSQASWLVSSRGAEGWELVSMYNGVLCYKRPEPSSSPPAAAPSAPPQAVAAGAQMPQVAPAPQAAPSPGATSPGPVTSASKSTVPKVLDPGF